MKAYVHTKKQDVRVWVAEVVSATDYHHRGPHAYTFRSKPHPLPTTARKEAEDWATRHDYTLVTAEQI
jgi:hypothetical protein